MPSIDAWRVLGLAGAALFATRWLVQLIASRRARRSVVPPMFWVLSALGSTLLVLYFTAGPHADLVGRLGNALPLATALYNLGLLVKQRRRVKSDGGAPLLGVRSP